MSYCHRRDKIFISGHLGFTPLEFLKNFFGVKRVNRKTLTGFTLIELLVVMFIISLLSAIMMADYRAGQKKYLVDKATQTLAANLRRAQSLALSGAQSRADDGSFVSGAGVHIDNGAAGYVIFADTVATGNEKYVFRQGGASYWYEDDGVARRSSPRCAAPKVSADCDKNSQGKDCESSFSATVNDAAVCFDWFSSRDSERYLKKTNIITGDKILETISLPQGITISPAADIFFEPPRPTTYIDYKNGANGASSKVFTLTNGNYSKNVTVDLSGRIDIQ